MRKKSTLFHLTALLLLLSVKSFSQTDSLAKLSFGGYVDAYYAYYNDSVGNGSYQKFPSICPRSGFGLNTAILTAQYDATKIRGTVSIHFGDIARSAWSSTFNPIFEAHAGIRLCEKVWLDGGFFRTHFGTEGLLPIENIASSISVNTWHEPYFESGFRLNYNASEKLVLNFFLLSGYNVYEDNNNRPSFGLLAAYALGTSGNIGYSNYIGDDAPTSADSISHLRIHNNLFFNYEVGKLKLQIGGDYCMQQNADTLGKNSATMFSGVLGLKYKILDKFSIYTREEIFNDPQGFMSGVLVDKENKQTGLKLWGATLGVEYKPTDKSYLRLEARDLMMDADQEIFHWNKKNTSSRMEVLFHMGLSF